MIESLLIANRGEIACRIIRTARKLGIRTVAVYSDADSNALHVRSADEAVHIGPSAAVESYLCSEKIIAAAQQAGAEAIHPGYGFLSENADFAQAVIDAGLIWVGPKPYSIRAMGLKDAAKTLMAEAGVPVTPGYLGDDQDEARLEGEAGAIGYPVLIKAVAGGGGKGMRKVDQAADFADALNSCRREAMAAFGNDHVLLEKWIESPRHIEVQIFGDAHGNVVHLFERDCSLQRRHQKVIEEAPAPGMDDATREALCLSAVRAAKAVDYVGAGTIEFIADASEGLRADRIWFMEMNTRLQVEHPVTEEITGQDLVEWQLRVASGEPLPRTQAELSIEGWAMEARIYAEDPAKGFLPSIGKLGRFDIGPDCRVDTGVERGEEISAFYDPMIAKLIAWGPDREAARKSLSANLSASAIWPLKTNAGFLARAIEHPHFVDATLDTGLIAQEGEALMPPALPSPQALGAAAMALSTGGALAGFRLNAPKRPGLFLLEGIETVIPVSNGQSDGSRESILIAECGQVWHLARWRGVGAGNSVAADGAVLSPMPGRIIAVDVHAGDRVAAGQRLIILEAMKMEHTMLAPFEGIVAELNIREHDQVSEGMLLVSIEHLVDE